jgi:hypothetical protein
MFKATSLGAFLSFNIAYTSLDCSKRHENQTSVHYKVVKL